MTIINGEGAILGRLASLVAKRLLMGEEITVVNAEKIVVSGESKRTAERFLEKRQRGDPYRGPFYPRYPDKIFRRCVRGMLDYKKLRGKQAFKRLRVCMGCPPAFRNIENLGKNVKDLKTKYTTLGSICKELGARLG